MTTNEPSRLPAPTIHQHENTREMTATRGTNRTARRLPLAVLAAAALALPLNAHAGELDGMAPDLFAHYARTRLAALAGAARSARTIEMEFDRKCRATRDTKQRESDCEVARDARHHLKRLVAEEREVVDHLRRDGQVDHPWVVTEDREFWSQVRAGRGFRP